jgi:hypothetical protein
MTMGGETREINKRSLVETGKMFEDDISFSSSLLKEFHASRKVSIP